jgi:hypothetical protein
MRYFLASDRPKLNTSKQPFAHLAGSRSSSFDLLAFSRYRAFQVVGSAQRLHFAAAS